MEICDLPCYMKLGDKANTVRDTIHRKCKVCGCKSKCMCRQCSLANFGEIVAVCDTKLCRQYHEDYYKEGDLDYMSDMSNIE
jgi:hypothetical protein